MLSVNNVPISYSKFPGGEIHLSLPSELDSADNYLVDASLFCSDDVMALIMLTDALDEMNTSLTRYRALMLRYVPYGRQDRVCNYGEALGVRAFARLINSLGYSKVLILDPHSEVTPALINNCHVTDQFACMVPEAKALVLKEKWGIVSPDAGAEKKIHVLAKKFSSWAKSPPVLYAAKIRELSTGVITGTTIHGADATGNWLIIDDICDGGRTFIELAKVLRAAGASKVSLSVTHGILSAGLEPLKAALDHVFCQYTFRPMKSDNFITIGEPNEL